MEETQEEVAEEEAEAEEVELPEETPVQVQQAQDKKVCVRHLEMTFSITVKKGRQIRSDILGEDRSSCRYNNEPRNQ